jgi:hypothetical protein
MLEELRWVYGVSVLATNPSELVNQLYIDIYKRLRVIMTVTCCCCCEFDFHNNRQKNATVHRYAAARVQIRI